MKLFIKQLFCAHEWKHLTSKDGEWEKWVCLKCDKWSYKNPIENERSKK